MYRYYKSFTTGEFVVMFDNALIGAVEDSRYKTENEAIERVSQMSKRYFVRSCPAARNLWCVWDKKQNTYVYCNLYSAECERKCAELTRNDV